MKKYRFFYHYYRQKKCMTVHFKKTCNPCADVICHVPTETKWNKKQPQLVIQGFCSKITNVNGKIIIE